MKTKIPFLLTLFFSFSINAQIDFQPHVTVDDTGGANGANSVFAADLDGDGDLDMLSASAYDNKIAWYENTDGAGDFGPQQIISTTIIDANSVFATDIDGDGNIDVLAAAGSANKIVWFKNIDGQANFGTEQLITIETERPTSVSAGDVDNDGDMDVFSTSRMDNKIAWYENVNGQGAFGEQQVISTDFDTLLDIKIADFNGDGYLDVLSGSSYANQVVWFKNSNGQGDFIQQQILTTDIQRATAAVPADIDGDDDMDIVVASNKLEQNRIIWFENTNGQGNFNGPNTISLDIDNLEALYAADIDNDDDIDVIAGTNSAVYWFENSNGGNTFGPPQTIDSDVSGVESLFASDIVANGSPEILIASSREDKIAWYKNTNGQGDFGPSQVMVEINSANGVYEMDSADLDGDGDKDIVAALLKDDRIVWQQNLDGQGTFSELITIANVSSPRAVYVGDFNGDEYLDLLAASDEGKLIWYKNLDGLGNFGPEQIINTEYFTETAYATDIDNDGDLDVFSAKVYNIYWQENLDGLGNFGPIQIISNEIDTSDSMVAADFDNDGDKDLVASSYLTGQVAWFENIDGQGAFGSSNLIDTLISLESVYAADLDNDEDIDVVTLDLASNEVLWYENTDGQGNFGTAQIISSEFTDGYSVYAEDIDSDGDMDVLAASFTDNGIVLFINDGQGNFDTEQIISSQINKSTYVCADDFNDDGKMDVLASSFTNDEIIWFENRGPLSIEENTTNFFSIYPNPTGGLLKIQSVSPISEITVYNKIGQLLFTSEEKNSVDISFLNQGIYFIKIVAENGQSETKKVVKN